MEQSRPKRCSRNIIPRCVPSAQAHRGLCSSIYMAAVSMPAVAGCAAGWHFFATAYHGKVIIRAACAAKTRPEH